MATPLCRLHATVDTVRESNVGLEDHVSDSEGRLNSLNFVVDVGRKTTKVQPR